MAALLGEHLVGEPQHLDVELHAQGLAQVVDPVEEVRQAPLDEDRYDFPLRGVGFFQKADFPFGVGDPTIEGARAEPRGEGQDRTVAEELLVEFPGIGRALRAVFVDGNPERTQRFEVHQQVVDHHTGIAEAVDQLVGEHHAVHPPEGMVRDEKVAAPGVEAFEPFGGVGDPPFAEGRTDELLGRQRPVAFEDVVDLPFVDRAAEPRDDRSGDPVRRPRGFFPDYGADVYLGHGIFENLVTQIYGFFFGKTLTLHPKWTFVNDRHVDLSYARAPEYFSHRFELL